RRGLFYRRYALAAAREGKLRVAFLRIDERAAATQLAVEWDHGYWLLKIGYRDEFARCSPGSLLVAETIRYAAERGLSHYEFLGSVEAWTRTWTDAERACVSVRVYPYGWAGMAALALDAGERAAHDVGERMGVRS
ncbi:MAG: GNAT family N-acetyltransferase, partial [Polyangiaceae bacterium]|nr:GNAT family N-acetyltransferase [Polyangiaceae bacterium]